MLGWAEQTDQKNETHTALSHLVWVGKSAQIQKRDKALSSELLKVKRRKIHKIRKRDKMSAPTFSLMLCASSYPVQRLPSTTYGACEPGRRPEVVTVSACSVRSLHTWDTENSLFTIYFIFRVYQDGMRRSWVVAKIPTQKWERAGWSLEQNKRILVIHLPCYWVVIIAVLFPSATDKAEKSNYK